MGSTTLNDEHWSDSCYLSAVLRGYPQQEYHHHQHSHLVCSPKEAILEPPETNNKACLVNHLHYDRLRQLLGVPRGRPEHGSVPVRCAAALGLVLVPHLLWAPQPQTSILYKLCLMVSCALLWLQLYYINTLAGVLFIPYLAWIT